ncbi:shikimate kinase [Pontimicrobium aquaticum]|uniref:Shikimate kinase n=1 Tax=Pontimicrobium aquaticum TaxID=2565367 RepID=A0A4U0EL31_9FLAO|nr:shikimate kinase [Pontimicrobium aquaticum]TJY32175.1 shikimate kinase [Pontimicrobium aquaticum]
MIIVLMGYMASGKSFIGKSLAKKLNYNFFDLDDYIEKKEEKSITEIFNSSGEIYFRKIETNYLKEILTSNKDIVLSLGGGTPCYGTNLDLIKNTKGVVSFYLNASIKTIISRLENEPSKRPLLTRVKSNEELQEFIGKHLFERNQFYNQANYTIETNNATVDSIVEDIVAKLF